MVKIRLKCHISCRLLKKELLLLICNVAILQKNLQSGCFLINQKQHNCDILPAHYLQS